MRKTPIKVKLTKTMSAMGGDYKVASITGAITIWSTPPAGIQSLVRVGDFITEKQAETLCNSYLVTVTA